MQSRSGLLSIRMYKCHRPNVLHVVTKDRLKKIRSDNRKLPSYMDQQSKRKQAERWMELSSKQTWWYAQENLKEMDLKHKSSQIPNAKLLSRVPQHLFTLPGLPEEASSALQTVARPQRPRCPGSCWSPSKFGPHTTSRPPTPPAPPSPSPSSSSPSSSS